MKKKIIIPLLATMLMLQSILPVSASELPTISTPNSTVVLDDTSEAGETTDSVIQNNHPDFEDGDNVLAFPAESTIVPTDDLVGISATTPNKFTLSGGSISGYAILDAWKYFYIYNKTGHDIYVSNIYVQGNYQFRNKKYRNNTSISCHWNSNGQAVLYYKYDASTRHLLTTWSRLEDWPYLDVFPTVINWEYNAIKYCADRGLMVGTGANLFDPNVPITRAMFATIVYRMAGSPKVTYSNVFPDVPSGQWYSDGITWASKNGIVKGFGNGYYAPNEIITREQATAILQRYAKYRGYQVTDRTSLSSFSDGAAVSAWAKENVSWAVAKGLMSGRPSGSQLNLAPKASTSRAECASMIMRYKENIGQ